MKWIFSRQDIDNSMTDQKANCRIFLSRFPVCFIFYVLLFLVTPCLLVAVQPCMDWISIKKLSSEFFFKQGNSLNPPMEVMKWISSRQDGSLILCHSIYINYFKCMSHYLIFNKWWLHIGYGMMVIHISSTRSTRFNGKVWSSNRKFF